jgi:hypothetical protein
MIGSNNSPMSRFRGIGNGSGPSMYEIGYRGSPGGSVADALHSTIAKYDAHRSAQQEQTNKLALLKEQYGMMGDNSIALADAKRKAAMPDPSVGQMFDPNKLENNIVTVGGVTMYREPVRNSYGDVTGWKLKNPRALSMMDIVNDPNGGGGGVPADDEVSSTLKELEDLKSQLPQGL